jgi:hypothetical protein
MQVVVSFSLSQSSSSGTQIGAQWLMSAEVRPRDSPGPAPLPAKTRDEQACGHGGERRFPITPF